MAERNELVAALPAEDTRKNRRLVWWPAVAAGLIMTLWALLAVYLSFRRHETLHTAFFDMGSYTQLVYNIANGRPFVWSHNPPLYLGDHFSPMLLVLAPLFRLLPDARTLQAVGMLALASSLLPGYFLLRQRSSLLGTLFVFGLALNPLLHTAASEDIHTIFLAAPTVGLAFYALHTGRYRLMLAGLALTLLVREDMPIYVASFGLYLFLFRPSQRRLGVAVGAVAVAWLLLVTGVLMPALNGGAYRHSGQLDGMAKALGEAWIVLTSQPLNALPLFLSSNVVQSLASILLPLALLPLLGGGYVVLWLPAVVVLLLSPEGSGFGLIHGWRLAPLLPLWFGTAAVGVSRLHGRMASGAVLALVACSLVAFFTWSSFPGGGRYNAAKYESGPRTEVLRSVLSRVRPEMAVAATDHLGAQLGTRERHFLFPYFGTDNPPDIAIVDFEGQDRYPLSSAEEFQAAVEKVRLDPAVRGVWYENGVFVFSFTDAGLAAFPHNYGVPMHAYSQALEKAKRLGGGAEVYLPVSAADAAGLRDLAAKMGVAIRTFTASDTLLLAGGNEASHLYVVNSGEAATEERLRALGFAELAAERIPLPDGRQSLRFYALSGSARERVASALSQSGPEDLRLSNGLQLWRWQAARDLRGQSSLPLVAAWQLWDTPRPFGADAGLCLSQHLVDVEGKSLAVADREMEQLANLRQGDLLITWTEIPLSKDLSLQKASLRLGLYGCWQRQAAVVVDSAGKVVGDGLHVGSFKVGVVSPSVLSARFASGAQLGEEVSLVDFHVGTAGVGAGDSLKLDLYWRALDRPAADYTVFVQLLGAGGVVAQQDSPPRGGRYPTSVWDKGESVIDEHTLVLKQDLGPGVYRLIAGMYTPADVRRLPVRAPDGNPLGDVVELGTLTVGQGGEASFRRP